MNKILEFFCVVIGTLIILFFATICLIRRLEIRFNKFSEDRINRIEQIIENVEKPKGFFLHTLLMYMENYPSHDIPFYVLIASLELNLSKTERIFLCMKYPEYAKYIK